MSKVRLSNEKRDRILRYMQEQYEAKRDKREEQAALRDLLDRINDVLLSRYPAKDMAVLRKYELTRRDYCLKFAVLDTGRVFQINLPSDQVKEALAEIPSHRGCYSRETYPCDQALADAADHYLEVKARAEDARRAKYDEYSAFVYAARTLEDIEAIVPLPQDLRAALGATPNALVAVNENTLASIKQDFAQAA